MRTLGRALVALVTVVPLLATAAVTPAAAAECDPFTTPAAYAGNVPTADDVLGFPLGSQEVTVNESDRYVEAVDESSAQVSSGVLATSHEGRPLVYAVVGEPDDVRRAKRAATTLRDAETTPAEAASTAADAPAIAWVAGNVHGNEESGTDAALRLLYDLADRTDCAASQILDNTVVAILPTQNPDGRVADTRRNAYGFDMNRDWFARTQPETDGKLELLRELPPVLFIDDHEMGADGFFFPPNADPVYHDIPDRSVTWINDLYGSAMADEFDRQAIPFFNYDIYDLLYMGYGDTVPTTGFLGAGMTLEKNNAESIGDRTDEQFTAVWASVSALALDKDDVLTGWAASHRQALREGRRGKLEPNEVFAPGNTVEAEVPDIRVRHYFIENTDQAKRAEVRALVRRLQRMDVDVRRLTAPLRVPDYTPYGRAARAQTLPAGTYWVPMAQSQKHWVQAMLNESTYVPFPYFYDVTAWSGPLLFNVAGGRSGEVLRPRSALAAPVSEPAPPARPQGAASVGLWQLDDGTSAFESAGWMRWLFDKKWRIPFREVVTADISEGGLTPIDVLVVPNGDAEAAYEDLGPDGRRSVREWLGDGGRLVGLRGGTELAARLQLTTARLSSPTSDVPGSLVRARTRNGPLARGVGRSVWSFYEYDNVMRVTDPRSAAVRYPAAASSGFFVSGFEEGAEELGGTAAVVDEPYGDGRVVVFAAEPNFRAFTDGTQKVLWNAIYRSDPARASGGARLSSSQQDQARGRSARAAEKLVRLDGQMLVTVRADAAEPASAVLRGRGLKPTVQRVPGGVRYVVDIESSEESPVARRVARDLKRLGSDVVALRMP